MEDESLVLELQERIRELEKKVQELEALIKTQAQTSNKNSLNKNPLIKILSPEEQLKKNQAAMDWAKQRLQAIKDKWGWEN